MTARNERGWWRRLSAADASPWADSDLDSHFGAVNDERTRNGRPHARRQAETPDVAEAEL